MNKLVKRILALMVALVLNVSFAASADNITRQYSTKVKNPKLVLPMDKSNMIENGCIVFEAEDIIEGTHCSVQADEGASGGMAVHFPAVQWYTTNYEGNDIYSEVQVGSPEEAGRYKIWVRIRTISRDTASYFIDINKGVFMSKFFNENNFEYLWSDCDIYLNEGKNHFAIKARSKGYVDKIIITSNLDFVPEGTGEIPEYKTKQQMEEGWAKFWNEPEIKPIEGHPRLYLTPEYIEKFNTQYKHTDEIKSLYDEYKAMAYTQIDSLRDTSVANNHDANVLAKIMARAFLWVIGDETNPTFAKETIQHTKNYLNTVRTPDDTGDITRTRGNYMVTAAIVYDWCYDELTDEDKAFFIEKFEEIAVSKEIGWPPVNMSSVSSHAGEQEIFRDILAAGIAIYDEFPLMYNLAAGRMFDEMIPARMWLRPAGKFDQGSDYGPGRFYSEVWADMTIQRMGYPSIYGDNGSKALRSILMMRMPYGSMMPDSDMFSYARGMYARYYINYSMTYCIAGNLYRDGQIKLEFERLMSNNALSKYDGFFRMIFTDPTVETQLYDENKLSEYYKYPLSSMVARTGWQEGFDSPVAMAFMDMHEIFLGDHMHLYTGNFDIYYKGLLAMTTGSYNASSEMNQVYNWRAIAANTMLVHDPNETFKPLWSNTIVPNDGGQRTPKTDGAYVMQLSDFDIDENGVAQNKNFVVSKNVRHYIGPDKDTPVFSYITGDLTNAYTSKVKDYHRSMVFINLDNKDYPAAFVVYDKMDTSNKNFKKTWLLHSMEKPEITGNTTTIKRTEDGFNGKLVNYTLLPENDNTNIEVIGGDNNEMFTTGGKTYTPKANAIEAGKYRIELSPKKASQEDTFLNAMYVSDADSNLSQLPMYKESLGNLVGVSVMDKQVMFSKDATLISSRQSVNVRDNGYSEVDIMIADLAIGKWTLESVDGTKVIAETAEGENTAVFKVAPGLYKLYMADDKEQITKVEWDKLAKDSLGDFIVWKFTKGEKASGRGNFLFLEDDTKLIDGVPYVGVSLLKQYGVKVNVAGDEAVLTSEYGEYKIKAGSRSYNDGKPDSLLEYAPKLINGKLYVVPTDFEEIAGYSFKYNELSKILVSTSK